jgi:hypothetical protein
MVVARLVLEYLEAHSEFLQTRVEACCNAQVLWKKNEGEKGYRLLIIYTY